MKYQVILVDPPWPYKRNTGRGAAQNHYEVMTLGQLIAMRDYIMDLVAKDCVLFMWSTFPTIHTHALPVMAHWDFIYKTAAFVWVKVTKAGKSAFGPGQYTRANAEPCLIGIRGRPIRKDRGVPQIILAPRAEHSVKPAVQYNRIERLYDGPYIELFARRVVRGWDTNGMELTGINYNDDRLSVSDENAPRDYHRTGAD